VPQKYEYLDISKEGNPLLVEAKTKYNEAIVAFDKVYEVYARERPYIIKLNANSIEAATSHALAFPDTSLSGKVFGELVQRMLDTRKADELEYPVRKQVCDVLSKLFHLMRFALGLTGSVADV
jgi:hypothetical protein